MREYEAYVEARKRANRDGFAYFVVTNRSCPGYDYDVVSSGSLHGGQEVVAAVQPQKEGDQLCSDEGSGQ